jgi:hypothetical protein
LRRELGPVFMQLWGGHSWAGSAARPAPALTQQSPPAHMHADMYIHAHTAANTHVHVHR